MKIVNEKKKRKRERSLKFVNLKQNKIVGIIDL